MGRSFNRRLRSRRRILLGIWSSSLRASSVYQQSVYHLRLLQDSLIRQRGRTLFRWQPTGRNGGVGEVAWKVDRFSKTCQRVVGNDSIVLRNRTLRAFGKCGEDGTQLRVAYKI